MKRVKFKNGPLEMLIKRELRARGLRFQRHVCALPGSPDIVFRSLNVVVCVDGDFWHGWRLPAWEKKLSTFWCDKLRANLTHDQRNFRRLRAEGWRVIRLWQHQIKREPDGCIQRVMDALKNTSSTGQRR